MSCKMANGARGVSKRRTREAGGPPSELGTSNKTSLSFATATIEFRHFRKPRESRAKSAFEMLSIVSGTAKSQAMARARNAVNTATGSLGQVGSAVAKTNTTAV